MTEEVGDGWLRALESGRLAIALTKKGSESLLIHPNFRAKIWDLGQCLCDFLAILEVMIQMAENLAEEVNRKRNFSSVVVNQAP